MPTTQPVTGPGDGVEAAGARIPKLGMGTWQLTGRACADRVADALQRGVRHVDTARMYGNEEDVGHGLARSGVDRDEVFVTTKLWVDELSRDAVPAACDDSLKRLGLDAVDLLLIHWPSREVELEETLDAMLSLRERGRVRHVGVSNFTPTLLERAAAHAPVVCNQVEYHPFLSQDAVLEAARRRDMAVVAYSPLARGRVLDEPLLREIGDAHGKSPAQVVLRWLLQQEGVVAIPKAARSEHLEANLAIFDFQLSHDEMQRIRDLDRDERLIDPEVAPRWER